MLRASVEAWYLNACMTAQVEVKLKGVGDVGIHCCSCWDVPTLSNLQGIERDQRTAEFGYFQVPRALSLMQLPCPRTMAEGPHLPLTCRDGRQVPIQGGQKQLILLCSLPKQACWHFLQASTPGMT